VCRVYLQVIDDAPVDKLRLRGGAADVCTDIGIAWTSVSVPNASQGSGKIACRHRAIPDLPELEPPLSTIT
jgi:hypothetical protein